MKIEIKSIIILFFVALSVWLSFSVKKTNEKQLQSEIRSKTMEQELNLSRYQLGILQEALDLNFGKAPVQISSHTPLHRSDTRLLAILYLKAHSCSPCNMTVINALIRLGAEKEHFKIVSHISNRHFLKPVIEQNGLLDSERVDWLTGKLYDYQHPVYDAELLFVDAKGFILGVLPLELLKERDLFEPWLAPLYPSEG